MKYVETLGTLGCVLEESKEGLWVKGSGVSSYHGITIDMNDFSSDDKEIIEDMVLVAVNSAIEKMEADKADKFGKYGQMFNGLM